MTVKAEWEMIRHNEDGPHFQVKTVKAEWEMITHSEDGPHFQVKTVKAEWEKTGHNEDAKIHYGHSWRRDRQAMKVRRAHKWWLPHFQ